jgi:hypothetical protein
MIARDRYGRGVGKVECAGMDTSAHQVGLAPATGTSAMPIPACIRHVPDQVLSKRGNGATSAGRACTPT